MKKIILILLFGFLLLILSFFILPFTASSNTTWSIQWIFDSASPDYDHWATVVPSISDRIEYSWDNQPLAAYIPEHNLGYGPAGKPRLSVFVASGVVHSHQQCCPHCTHSGGPLPQINGSITCLDHEGNIIWRYTDSRIFSQTKLELGDATGNGYLDLLVTAFHIQVLLNATSGEVIWEHQHNHYRMDKFSVIIRDPRETIGGSPNPDYGKVFIYTPIQYHAIAKRDGATGNIVGTGVYSNGPCFGGVSAGDMTGDGIPNIVEHTYGASNPSGSVFCYDLDLNLIWRDTSAGGGGSTPVLVDVNGNGWLDVVKTSGQGSGFRLGVIDGKQSYENRYGNGTGTAVLMQSLTNFGLVGHNAPAVAYLGDGKLLAFTCHGISDDPSKYRSGAVNLNTWQKDAKWDYLIKQSWDVTIGNIYGDNNYLEVFGDFYNNKVFDYHGNVICQTTNPPGGWQYSWGPILIADINGNGYNEVVVHGNSRFVVPSTPWGSNHGVWSYGWFVCYSTDAETLNPNQNVYSQHYSERRLSSEIPVYQPLWYPLDAGDQDFITIISPNGGEEWKTRTNQLITWTSSNFSQDVKIELYKNDTYERTIAQNAINTGSYNWLIAEDLNGNTFKIKITKIDDESVYDFSANTFTIYTIYPPPEITNIQMITSIPLNTDPAFGWENITCTIKDNQTIHTTILILTYPNSTAINHLMTKISNTNTYYFNTTLTVPGHYLYQIRANNTHNSTSYSSMYTFSLPPNWDINKDGECNIIDMVLISNAFGQEGKPGWIREDVDNNGIINIFDLLLISNKFRKTWS